MKRDLKIVLFVCGGGGGRGGVKEGKKVKPDGRCVDRYGSSKIPSVVDLIGPSRQTNTFCSFK